MPYENRKARHEGAGYQAFPRGIYVPTYDLSLKITLMAIVLATLSAIVIVHRLTVSIARPIAQALECADIIAQGDLRVVQMDVAGNDEAAQLLRAIVVMRDNLSDTLSSVYLVANQLTGAAEELSVLVASSNTDLQLQNSEIEQAATAITEMSQAVDEVARNALGTSDDVESLFAFGKRRPTAVGFNDDRDCPPGRQCQRRFGASHRISHQYAGDQ
jgi:methyl-accepting chemotaxis protein